MTNPDNQNRDEIQLQAGFIEQMPAGSGEMAALMRQTDWSKTGLGDIATWPQSLQTAVSICLFSRFPILIWWGKDYIKIYNDAYRPILGSKKHPQALGQSGREIWSEIWHIIGPMLDSVYNEGKATWSSDQMLPMDRHGFIEETYFTFSYSPIFDESGGIGGIFTAVTETSRQFLDQRRLKTLHDLGERAFEAKTLETALQAAALVLANNPADMPFALIYLLDETAQEARLIASTGIEKSSDLYRQSIPFGEDAESPWPIRELLASARPIVVERLGLRFQSIPAGIWPEKPDSVMLLPLAATGIRGITGFLVAGLSPRLALDEAYQDFFELMAGHIASALANARAYEEERKNAEALAALDRAKTEFFSNISHEFRTPLTLMLNPLQELLSDSSQLSALQVENTELAYRNSLRLMKLVNTLLDFSRIQSNRIRAAFEPTDLAALTIDLASNFRSAFDRVGLGLLVDCPSLSQPVYVDREMWEKIVLNLLSNALKFTFEGGVAISLREENQWLILKVQDTGIGIPETELPHIFERFHRVRGIRARSHEGSGIGLALVAELVAYHKGQIELSSQVNQGSSFQISIPLGSEHLPQEQIGSARGLDSTALAASAYTQEALRWLSDTQTPLDGQELGKPDSKYDTSPMPVIDSETSRDVRILIIDDNTDMRDYLQRLLGRLYQVQVAKDGIDALQHIQQQPALVLADVMMPNMDGFALLKELRSNPKTATIPLILLSARAGEEARIEGLQAGADDYLIKPFSARELLARVESQLKLAKLRRDNQATVENIVESISDPFYVLDQGWHFIYVNQRAQEMLGKPREALIGKNIAEVFLQGMGQQAYETMQNALSQNRPMAFETFSSLNERWFEITIYPGSRGIAIYFRDIHERKLLEQEARLAREQIEAERTRAVTIFESISDAFAALDSEFRYSYLNPQAAELLYKLSGKSQTDLLGKTVWEAFPGSYDSPFGESYRQAMQDGRATELTAYFPPLETWFYVKIYPSKDGLSIYFTDVTEAQKLQSELHESRSQLAADLSGMIRLYKLHERLLNAQNLKEVLQEILSATLAFTGTNKGNIQLLSADGKRLEIAAYQGHQPAFLEHFRLDGANAICKAALESRLRVVIEDVTKEVLLQNSEDLKILLADGIQAVQSTPIITHQGRVIGMMNSHFPEPHRPSLDTFRQLDLLAWMAANFIEHSQLNEVLRETEERFLLAQEAGNIGIWDWKAETQETYWSETMWRLYGLEMQDPFKSNDLWEAMLHPEDRQRVQTNVNRFLASTETHFQDEFRIIRADAQIRWIEAISRVRRDAQNQPLRMYGVNLDINGRKQAESALREAEAYLREILDTVKDYAILALDADGYIMTWNKGAERLFGYTEIEILGKSSSTLQITENQAVEIFQEKMTQAIQHDYFEEAAWHQRKDGTHFYAVGMLRTMRDTAGKLKGFTQVVRGLLPVK